MENNENQREGFYSIIPATVLYDNELRPNEKLLFAIITSLANKEGFCYASNKYLASKFNVKDDTVSGWVSHLREKGYVYVEILRNEKKEFLMRKIYPNNIPYRINILYPHRTNIGEGIGQISEDNNINNNNINTFTVEKKKYAERVYLYEHEYKQLQEEYGIEKANKCITELDLYKQSKGIEYESDFATIKRWVILRVEELEQRQNKNTYIKKNKSVANFEQREYPAEFWESLYENNNFVSSSEDEMDLEM